MSSIVRITRRVVAEMRYVPRTLRLVWAATARWTTIWLALLFVQGVLPAIAVYLTKDVVDGLLPLMKSGAGISAAGPLIISSTLLAAGMILQVLVGGMLRWVRFLQGELLQDHITLQIHEKSVSVGMRFYDFPDYYDHLHRARDEARYRPVMLLDATGTFLQNVVTMTALSAVLLRYGSWLPTVLLLGSLPSLWFVLQNSLRRQEWNKQSTAHFRKLGYLEHLLTARETAGEIRLFNLSGHFIEDYQAKRRSLREEESRLVRGEAVGELGAALLGMTAGACAAGWMAWQAIQGSVTAGALAMFFAAFAQVQGLMRSLLQNAGQLYMNGLFLGNLFEFLALETESVHSPTAAVVPAQKLQRGITFEAVEFSYPGMTRKALAAFDLDIRAGQTVAIVGPNGAGKSTIIKLLCRFYEPDRGRILIDGVDIRNRSRGEIRRLVSALFQEPVRYASSVHDNVAPGLSICTPDDVKRAVRAAGADGIVGRLPFGYDTTLGKWFDDGVELSGGEWQRIALARAFCRDAPIVLLDEPTSAMDSWAEADWFERYRRLAADRTTIIITHRFTTAMQADVIHVMQDGRIVETGSHERLLALGGKYASSWLCQTREQPVECPA